MRVGSPLNLDLIFFYFLHLWIEVFTSILLVIISMSIGIFTINLGETAIELCGIYERKYLVLFPDKVDALSLMMSFHTANEQAICLDTWFYFYDL